MTPRERLSREESKAQREGLELLMLQHLRALGLDDGMVREHRFHEVREWRFDFAWLPQKLALEVDGATWSRGRHTSGDGFAKDCVKFAHAAIGDWRVIRATGEQVKSGVAAQWVAAALGRETV